MITAAPCLLSSDLSMAALGCLETEGAYPKEHTGAGQPFPPRCVFHPGDLDAPLSLFCCAVWHPGDGLAHRDVLLKGLSIKARPNPVIFGSLAVSPPAGLLW